MTHEPTRRRPHITLQIPSQLAAAIPRGLGNKEILSAEPFRDAARKVLGAIAHEKGRRIERIAVDAPAAPPEAGSRSSETELGRLGLSSFKTPAKSDWADIREKCARHLRSGGSTASLPHANKIWMLFGSLEWIRVHQKLLSRTPHVS